MDAARNAQAGVNTDEEMTNMVEYQKAYEASAKFVVAINSMLETLLQMVEGTGAEAVLPEADIHDWPTLAHLHSERTRH